MEIETCQNCKKNFVIEPEDFNFYEKIKVPPPTFCPECRFQRRMAWRNERALHKRKCDALNHSEDLISMYAPDINVKVYDIKYWWSDKWDPFDYGKKYDFSKPFFVQFQELFSQVPQINLSNINSINSDYCNWSDQNKNCYLDFGCGWNENINYANKTIRSKDSQDLLSVQKSELCYECVNCIDCYNLRYCQECKDCVDSIFLYDCKNCSHCFGCLNLNSVSYCVWNKQYSKEEYFEKLKEFSLTTKAEVQATRDKFQKEIYLKSIHRFANIIKSINCTGNNIVNSKNSRECFDNFGEFENSKYIYIGFGAKNCYDCIGPGKVEESYENVDTNVGSHNISTITVYASNNVYYSWNCHGSSNLFGCISLRSKNYCILNHQYTKDEYEKLVPKIIEQMNKMPYKDSKGRTYKYGEFFPAELSPFCYNETIAQEYFPLTKEQALKQGYKWKDRVERNYEIDIKTKDILDNIKEVNEEMIGKVIECEHQGKCNEQCTEAFKIIESELQFYQRMNLPIPHLCPNCRHYQRLKQRNPLKLWHRSCMCDKTNHFHGKEKCEVEFETSYAPERPEIIYCEKCYQQEVY